MGYCTTYEVDLILGQALTSARAENAEFGVKQKLWEIGHVRDKNVIPDDVVNYYISLGDSQIDGILSQQYMTPLKDCVHGQWDLDADIDEYNQVVEISNTRNLNVGDQILIYNSNNGDTHEDSIATIIDQYSFTVLAPMTNFIGSGIVVKRIMSPPPINQVSARYAASFIYDKYFSAQNDPNVSDYGNKMREVAMGQLNDVLNGKVILKRQERIGDRLGNPWLDSSYAHRKPVDGYNTSDRDMSKPS